MTNTETIQEVEYEIEVDVMTTWATGSPKATAVRRHTITEEASILGGMRAIDKAIAASKGYMDQTSPRCTPNPALEGWPIGTVAE